MDYAYGDAARSAKCLLEEIARRSCQRRSQFLVVALILLTLLLSLVITRLYRGSTTTSKNIQHDESMPGMNMGSNKSPAPLSSLPSTPISSVTQMHGFVMPPGMIMTSDMSMEAIFVPNGRKQCLEHHSRRSLQIS